MLNKHVVTVGTVFENHHEQHGETVDQVWVRHYARNCGEDWQVYFLRSLIFCDETLPEARRALGLIVTYHHYNNLLPFPRILEVWTGEVAAGLRPDPETRRSLDADFMRNWAIVKAMAYLIEVEGLQPTRNITQNRIKRADCYLEGGSAGDVVGIAAGLRYGENLGYKRIESIWLASLSPDSPFYPCRHSDGLFIQHPLILRHHARQKMRRPDPAFIHMEQSMKAFYRSGK